MGLQQQQRHRVLPGRLLVRLLDLHRLAHHVLVLPHLHASPLQRRLLHNDHVPVRVHLLLQQQRLLVLLHGLRQLHRGQHRLGLRQLQHWLLPLRRKHVCDLLPQRLLRQRRSVLDLHRALLHLHDLGHDVFGLHHRLPLRQQLLCHLPQWNLPQWRQLPQLHHALRQLHRIGHHVHCLHHEHVPLWLDLRRCMPRTDLPPSRQLHLHGLQHHGLLQLHHHRYHVHELPQRVALPGRLVGHVPGFLPLGHVRPRGILHMLVLHRALLDVRGIGHDLHGLHHRLPLRIHVRRCLPRGLLYLRLVLCAVLDHVRKLHGLVHQLHELPHRIGPAALQQRLLRLLPQRHIRCLHFLVRQLQRSLLDLLRIVGVVLPFVPARPVPLQRHVLQ